MLGSFADICCATSLIAGAKLQRFSAMSNLSANFSHFFFRIPSLVRCFFLIFSAMPVFLHASPEMEKQQADRAYEQRDIENALKGYEKAYAGGLHTELMLYRMAFMYEQQEQYAQSIFCLKKIQFLYGGEWLMPKIQQLIELQNGFSRIPPSYPPALRVWLNRYALWVLIGIMFFAVLTGALVFTRRLPWRKLWLTASAAVSIAGAISILLYEYQRPNKVVVVQKNPCYQEPSYVLIKQQDPPQPGATLDITGEQDIWYRIGTGRYAYWIPKKIARNL